jgi:hypothetical protein
VSELTPEPTPTPTPTPEPVKTFTQEQVNALLAEQMRKDGAKLADYKDLKAKAARLDELEEKNKTDLQKQQERAEAAERRAAEAEAKAIRAEVAAEKGVPLNLLAGTTREELQVSADALLEFRGDKPKETVPALTPGNGNGGRPSSVAQVMADRAAAREARK